MSVNRANSDDRGIIARRAAVDIAEECQLRPLQNLLLEVALDQTEAHQIRTQAAHAVWRVGDDEARRRLSPLALGKGGDDPNDDLRGIALRSLWPGNIAASDVAKALVPPKTDYYIGHYEMFLHDAPKSLPEADLRVFLSMVAEWSAAYSHVRQLGEFQEQVMRRGWDSAESPGVAVALAKATNSPVLFTPVEIPLEVTEPVKLADQTVVVELKRAPIMAIKPTGEEVQLAQVVTPPPANAEVAMAATPDAARTLPSTASSLPLIGLLGLLAIIGAITLRAAERRVQ